MTENRLHAKNEQIGDLLVGSAFGDKLEHLPLPVRQALVGIGLSVGPLEVIFDQQLGHGRVEKGTAPIYGANCRNKLRGDCLLGDAAGSAGLDRGQDVFFVLMLSKNKDVRIRVGLANAAGCLQTVHEGHGYVQKDDVRRKLGYLRHGLPAVACLSYDLHVLVNLKQSPYAFAHYGVVIRYQYSYVAHE